MFIAFDQLSLCAPAERNMMQHRAPLEPESLVAL